MADSSLRKPRLHGRLRRFRARPAASRKPYVASSGEQLRAQRRVRSDRRLVVNEPGWTGDRDRSSPAALRLLDGRGDWIRTSDLPVPNRTLYQAEPRPDTTTRLSFQPQFTRFLGPEPSALP